jgi:hypothetical protein
MKKLFILSIFVLLLGGCTCIMSQSIPPQYLYMDSTCGAALPDYLPMFTYTDNCGIDTVWQSPTRGSWLTAPTTTVLIRAIDNFNNHTDLMFDVTLIDNKPPTITLNDSTLITDNLTKINNAYNLADRMLAYDELWFDSAFDYDAVGVPDSLQPLQQYFNKILVTWTTPALAFTGKGGRWHTFINESDTLLIVPKLDNWIGLLK